MYVSVECCPELRVPNGVGYFEVILDSGEQSTTAGNP
jgi:hypothetical protein